MYVIVAFPKMRLLVHTPHVSHVFSGADYDDENADNWCVHVEQVYSQQQEPMHFQELVDGLDESDNNCSTTDEETKDETIDERRMSMRTRQECEE